ncbi:helix-turn-helix transcriptional regulator [Neoroseomonas lacus]|uniref:Transcriptional regulator n=1 Tax=Neoroseomonas lacus TaxID=287609 RepID=A0A917KWQ1_9PROT|nr:YafY family protein [Neoroseomonas lacus]GGJ33397.1 transcriptional regulator [Neoroseomonas lacus]
MSRAARLLGLMQALRRRRRAVAAADLAAELGVSLRTIYRDIVTLVAEGAPIEGAAGLGYRLREGFFLPPLMLTEDEADAVLLGLRLVAQRVDAELALAADEAFAKIAAILPPAVEDAAAASALIAGSPAGAGAPPHLAALREAMRGEHKVRLRYVDATGKGSERVVWPIAIGFFIAAEVLAAWCELRGDFRHFRLDRIAAATSLPDRLPKRRRVLLAEWRAQSNLDD